MCLANLSNKSGDLIVNIGKKPHDFVKKNQWTTLKKPKWSWEVTSRFISKVRRNVCCRCGCFLPKSRYSGIYFRKLFYFKNKFLFINGSILETNDYFNNRSRENVIFSELSEVITTLSNQDFAGLDKFRLLDKKNKCFYCKSVIYMQQKQQWSQNWALRNPTTDVLSVCFNVTGYWNILYALSQVATEPGKVNALDTIHFKFFY